MYKKTLTVIFFIFYAFSLQSQEFYRSNSIGMALEKISSIRSDEIEYILKVEKKDGIVSRILYKDSIVIKRQLLQYNSEGDIVKETVTEDNKKTVTEFRNKKAFEELHYTDNILKERRRYLYSSDGKIISEEKYSSDGLLISKRTYDNLKDGRAAAVINTFTEDNKDIISNYSFTGPDIRSEWQGDSKGSGEFTYYKDGKIQYSENWQESKKISRTDYFYNKESDLVRTEENFLSGGKTLINKYDERRRIVSETEKKGSNTVKTVYNTYSSDNLIKKISKTGDDTEKYIYEYSGDNLVKELYYFNGSLRKKTVYEEGEGNYYEDLYSENIKYMRIYYRDNEKVKTEQ